MARSLEARLLEAGVVQPAVLEAAVDHQRRTGLPLGDCLVTEGALTEETYLKVLAQDAQTQFVTSAKLARLRIPEAAAEKVPVRLAERWSALPVAFDAERSTLTVACPDPADADLGEAVRVAADVEKVVRIAALESGIQAGIKQHYYRDRDAFTAEGQPAVLSFRCTQCRSWLSLKDFQCPACELLVNPDVRDAFREPSLVRALIAAPEANPGSGAKLRLPLSDNTRVAVRVEKEFVPRIIAGLDLAERPLHPFEAYVVSRTDGQLTVSELADVCGMGVVEVQSIFASLFERGVIELTDPRARLQITVEEEQEPAVIGKVDLVQVAAPVANAHEALTHSLLERVEKLERAGRVDDAITLLTDGIGRMQRPAPLYNRLALVLLNQRDDSLGAERILRLAVQLEPENAVFKQNLERVLQRVPGR